MEKYNSKNIQKFGMRRNFRRNQENIQNQSMQCISTMLMYQMMDMMKGINERMQPPPPPPRISYKQRTRRPERNTTQKQQTPKTQPVEYSRLYTFWNRIKCALTDAEIDGIMQQCSTQGNHRVENKIRNAMQFLQNMGERMLEEAAQYISQPTPKKAEERQTNAEKKREEKEERQQIQQNRPQQTQNPERTRIGNEITQKGTQNPPNKNGMQNITTREKKREYNTPPNSGIQNTNQDWGYNSSQMNSDWNFNTSGSEWNFNTNETNESTMATREGQRDPQQLVGPLNATVKKQTRIKNKDGWETLDDIFSSYSFTGGGSN